MARERETHGEENGETDIQKDKNQKQITCIPCSRITTLWNKQRLYKHPTLKIIT
jgi:hypothetical protein